MEWKSKTWQQAQNPNKSQHRGLVYEDSRSADFIMGNMKRYTMKQSKNTVVHLYSTDLADHLAWIPQVSYYQELISCKVSVGSKYAKLLSPSYPNLIFIESQGYHHTTGYNIPTATQAGEKLVIIGSDLNVAGIGLDNNDVIKAHGYNLQFGKDGKVKHGKVDNMAEHYVSESINRKEIPKNRQVLAAIKLGFKAYEEKPSKVEFPLVDPPTTKPYVTISTIGNEKWEGWQSIVNFLIDKNYVVVTIDDESPGLLKTTNFHGNFSIETKASHIKQAQFHIGVKNVWGWLAWSLRKASLTISGELPEWEHNSLHVIDDGGIDAITTSEVEKAILILEEEKQNGQFTE